jgi:hypothetical protein
MTQSAKLINGGLALVLISSSGCAGNGLRNMFSRNETAGYKTLEELEEERLAAEKNSEDESGPRFASWLPFGKKNAEETESIAAADDAVDESEEAKKSGWWRNPFRRQETIEADPFLENELPTEVVVAGKKDAKAKAEEVASAAKSKAAEDVAAAKNEAASTVKTVSATTEPEIGEDDELLVEKFEKHFQQTSESTVKAAEEGSDSFVAGIEEAAASKKKAAASVGTVSSAADKKLAEFEELMAAKKEAAVTARKDVQFEEEFEAAEDAADDFAESVAEASKAAEKQVVKKGKQAVSVDEFDSLFEPVEKPVAAKKKKTGSAGASSAATEDVKVARADDIFGKESVSGSGSGRKSKKSSVAGGWKSEESESETASVDVDGQSSNGQQSDLARKVIDTTVDQFAEMFSGARTPEGAPRATAPEADEWTAASQGKTGTGARKGVPVRTASNGRELGAALDTPAGLREDAFFSGGNNPPLVTNLQAVPESEMNGAQTTVPAAPVIPENASGKAATQVVQLPSAFSFRNIVLVIGGIIVAALLFAPGRKKPTEANQLPIQG